MLRPLKEHEKKSADLKFGVYDLEWYPGTYELRLFGVLSHDGLYSRFGTVEAALQFMARCGKMTWYAHFGGSADTAFVVESLLGSHTKARVILAGGSGIVALQIGEVTLADSFRLLPGKLSEIGEGMGIPKLTYKCPPPCNHPPEHPCEPYAPWPELVEYNKRDCEIVREALKRLSIFVRSFSGSRMRLTLASTALEIFRRHYLDDVVTTSEEGNELGSESYIASRVEVFSNECHDVTDYDINSSFPASMALAPCPGNIRTSYVDHNRQDLATIRAVIEVPDCAIPPLPVRHEGRIWHPTGKWEGVYTATELRYLEECGGKVLRIRGGFAYNPLSGLDTYAKDLYERRRVETDPFLRYLLKILLNSLYGKFAEREDREEWVICPDAPIAGAVEVRPGCLRISTTAEVPHRWVPISAEITARSRILLTRLLRKCVDAGATVHYCDTDSNITNATLETGDGLGELKGKPIKEGYFLSPKLYALRDAEGIFKVRAKGFPKLSFAQFKALSRGEGVNVRRMARFRETMRGETVAPHDNIADKAIRRIVPKRNGPNPWTYNEIMRGDPYGRR
jgi:hypothetical protein